MTYRVLDIRRGTTVDGPGFRTAIYLAGCRHACPGCHNPESWNPDEGVKMTLEEIMAVVREEDFNVTLTGGDPLFHPEACRELIESIAAEGYTVWVYTGYTWEKILNDSTLYYAVEKAECVVEGPFIEALKDPDLLFRGSSNQRIISPATGSVVKN